MPVDLARLRRVLANELGDAEPRAVVAHALTSWLPPMTGLRLRPLVLRRLGFHVGRETVVMGALQLTGGRGIQHRLRIGRGCVINHGVSIEATAAVELGDRVALGQDVRIITNAHLIGPHDRRHGDLVARPVVIEDGAWVSTRATILPGVTIGRGAVVAAGAVVRTDVAPDTLVGGVPARLLARLGADGERLPIEGSES
ncbi:MAG: acyltransferase [Acidimicrobiales bacterium]